MVEFPMPSKNMTPQNTWVIPGGGVDVYSNGSDEGTGTDCVHPVTTSAVNGEPTGEEWQCVELINRLYLTRGWIHATWQGGAGEPFWDYAPSNLERQAEGSVSYLGPGDVVIINVYYNGSLEEGHALVVNDSSDTSNGTVSLVSQNSGEPSTSQPVVSGTLTGGNVAVGGGGSGWTYTTIGVVHAPPVWTDASPTDEAQDNDRFSAVSCTGTNDCVAVGAWWTPKEVLHALIEAYTGSWLPVSSVQPTAESELNAVSCAGATFCAAVGHTAGSSSGPLIETSNMGKWKVARAPAPYSGTLLGVSCTSPTYCVAVGYYYSGAGPLVETFNGNKWSLSPKPGGNREGSLSAVSCVSKAFCLAVGARSQGGNQKIFTEELVSGSVVKSAASTLPASLVSQQPGAAVSCTSASFCEMVGNFANSTNTLVDTFNGQKWSTITEPSTVEPNTNNFIGALDVTGVSCTGSADCALTGYNVTGGPPAQWAVSTERGPDWATTSLQDMVPSVDGQVRAVSCSQATGFCMAVGSQSGSVVLPLALSVTL
jgi:hypothetical protein